MASLTSPASPLVPCTPAILQGGLAPWGPTPSPSPLIRFPALHAVGEGCGSSTGRTTPLPTPEEVTKIPTDFGKDFTQELLMEICAPHIERMIQALYQAVEAQIERYKGKDFDLEASPGSGTPSGGASPVAPLQSDPFRSLFDPATPSHLRRPPPGARKGSGCGGGGVFMSEPVVEEPEASCDSAAHGQQQLHHRKVADRFSSSPKPPDLVLRPDEEDVLSMASGMGSRAASASASPIIPGIEPPKQHEPLTGCAGGSGSSVIQDAASMPAGGSSSSAAAKGIHHGVQPIYLALSQDNAYAAQSWGDMQRVRSPAISPLVTKKNPQQPQSAGALVLALGRQNAGQERSASHATDGAGSTSAVSSTMPGGSAGSAAATAANAAAAAGSAAALEKSVMVCRHWKSKGWCKLEAECKFLHPESKRGAPLPSGGGAGSSAPAAKATASGSTAGSGAAAGETSTAKGTAENSSPTKTGPSRTRRAGRGRHGAGSGSNAAAPVPAAVAVGLVPRESCLASTGAAK